MANGIVLSGGGARAAYQVGVLRAISEFHKARKIPFRIISGSSAGSINGAFIAARADDFKSGIQDLWKLWAGLKSKNVFHTDVWSLGHTAVDWFVGLSLGGIFNTEPARYLLNTAPLRKVLAKSIDFDAIQENISSGLLDGVSIATTNYESGNSMVFFDGNQRIKGLRDSQRSALTLDHVMASTALPVFFPAVKMGGCFYGDGCIRHSGQMGSAIHMGASRVLAIGVKHPLSNETHRKSCENANEPSIAQIIGIIFNTVFMDDIEKDIDLVEQINRTLKLVPQEKKTSSEFKDVPILALRPSGDLAGLAREHFGKLPFMLKHLFRGFGASEEEGWDFLSYLTFDKAYTLPLMEMGYSDAEKNKKEIVDFLEVPA